MPDGPTVINDTLEVLYGTVDGTSSWASALRKIAQVTGADRLTLHSVGRDGSFRQDSEPFDPEGVLEFAQNYAGKDLRVKRILDGRRGIMQTHDLMTPEEIARCPIHNEFYRLYPECWNTMIVPIDGERALVAPTIQRRANKGAFTQEEGRILDALARHIGRVVEMNDVLPSATITNDGIVAAFDGLDDGIIIFDQAGMVLHMNAPARAVVAAKDGLELIHGVLTASHRTSRPALFQMMTKTLRVAAGQSFDLPKPIGVQRHTAKRPLILRAYVSPSGKDANRMGILKIQDRSAWDAPSIETVQAATGLTPSEAKLAVALLDGVSVQEYARRSDLSEHTVRTHLKHIRAKLGVPRQANVVAVLARLCG